MDERGKMATDSPVSSSARKKSSSSANHLLQFTLPPRQRPPAFSGSSNRKSKSSYQPYDKKRFVHANFRFVVSSRYTGTAQHVLDSDAVVPWEFIEQVVVSSSSDHSCPICLCMPVAPQIAPCGHVFCSSCILHYLALGEKSWRSCPICHDYVHPRELRSAFLTMITDYSRLREDSPVASSLSAEEVFLREAFMLDTAEEKRGSKSDQVIMRLMQRSTGSTTVLPRAHFSNWALSSLPRLDSSNQHLLHFSKVMIASPLYVAEYIINPELQSLYRAVEDSRKLGDVDEIQYLDMAVAKAKQRLLSLRSSDSEVDPAIPLHKAGSANNMSGSFPSVLPPPMMALDPFHDLPHDGSDVDDTSESGNQVSSHTTTASSIDPSPVLAPEAPAHDLHSAPIVVKIRNQAVSNEGLLFFYQALDGQHLYLHPLDIKIIKSEYGDYCNFPDEICVKIDCLTESTLTEEARKRFKYVSHLPLGCDVSFVEIDWKNGKNTCRHSVTRFDATSLAKSPSNFGNKCPASDLHPLVHESSIKQWAGELKARSHKRKKKQKKEHTIEARRRRDSSSKAAETADVSHATIRHAEQPEELFDFDDDSKWVPLGSASSNHPVNLHDNQRTSTTENQVPPHSPLLTPVTPVGSFGMSQSLPSYAAKAQGAYSPLIIANDSPMDKKNAKKKRNIVLFSNSSGRRA